MRKNNLIILVLAISFALTGCFKEEIPTKFAGRSPNSKYVKLDCNSEANQMVFYDLSTGLNHSAPNNNWHLAFDALPNGNSVRVNLTRSNYHLYVLNTTDFKVSSDDVILQGTEIMDSVSDWYSGNAIQMLDSHPSKVYVYTQEPDLNGSPQGKIKFQITEATNKTYSIRFLNEMFVGAKPIDFGFDKYNAYNFNYFSFNHGGRIVEIEPHKENWDIVFTQYRDMVKFEQDNKFYPYQVLGTLINPYKTSVFEIPYKARFDEIDHQTCKLADWCIVSNTIGFDWKYYSLNNGVYTTDTSKVWLLNDNEEFVNKMRFINYYNNNGNSGYPSFEYAKFN